MNETQKALGKRIQGLRQRAGITQEQLSEKASLSLKHLGEIERGRTNATVATLQNLALAFNISLAELCDVEHERLSLEELKQRLHGIITEASEDDSKTLYRLWMAIAK